MSYPAAMMERARQHYASEWNPREITELLEREFGRRPAENTVRCWVDQRFREANYTKSNSSAAIKRAKARKGRLAHPAMTRSTNGTRPEFKLARMQALREIGLPVTQIAKVMELDFGDPMSDYKVRQALAAGGGS